CSNLASLLLARASGRRQEIDMRLALGASRGRLVRQLLTESVVLSSLGGVLALGIAWIASPVLVHAMSGGRTPILLNLRPDWRTLTFAAGLSLLTGVLFGIVPAIRSIRREETVGARHGSHVKSESRRWSAALIVSQVALCVVVLASAGLLLESLYNLQKVDPGFRKDHILLVGVRPGMSNYRGPRAMQLHQELYSRLKAVPGALAVTLAAQPPLGGLAIITDNFSLNSVGPH